MHGISAKSAAVIGAPNCGYPASGLDNSVIRLGDDYLRRTVEAIRSSPVWKDDTAIMLVWDEDDYAAAGGLKGSPIGRNGVVLGGGRAPLVVVTSKDNPARKIDAPYNLQPPSDARSGLWRRLPRPRLRGDGRANRRLVRVARGDCRSGTAPLSRFGINTPGPRLSALPS